MIESAVAFATFLALHSVLALPAVRAEIIRRTGRPIYFAVYSALSLTALAWVFSSALSLDYVPLWDLQPWGATITFVLIPAGLFLVRAGLFSQNPLSVSVRSTGSSDAPTRSAAALLSLERCLEACRRVTGADRSGAFLGQCQTAGEGPYPWVNC